MKFQVMSDIHIEFPNVEPPKITPLSDVLFLAGDIGKPSKPNMVNFLRHMASIFPQVYFVAGNHEFYFGEYWTVKKEIEGICADIPNLHFLDRGSVLWINESTGEPPVRIIGCTLWSHVPESDEPSVSRMLNDYHTIQYRSPMDGSIDVPKRLTVRDTNAMHQADVQFIEQELAKSREAGESKAIVMTHHAPLSNGVSDPQYENGGSPIASAFQTPLDHLMGHNLKYWLYGHTHYNGDVTVNGTRVVANQAGYVHEKMKWNPDTVFEI